MRCETTNENRVFKPGIYIPKLTSSQARGSFVFDPGDYYSLFLLKGFGFCNFDFRDYVFRLFYGSDLFLSMNFLIHFGKVRPNFIFDPGIGLSIPILNKHLKISFVFIIFSVSNSFHSCVGDTLNCFPLKEGGRGNNSISYRTICDFQSLGNDSIRIMNKRVRDLEKKFLEQMARFEDKSP